MKFKINKSTKLYLLCPSGYATGGPEAIHRLCDYLRTHKNINAMIFYIPNNNPNPTHKNYKDLNIKIAYEIEDSENNIILSPELYSFIELILKYKKIKKIIWWLSVDNLYINYKKLKFISILNAIKLIVNKISLSKIIYSKEKKFTKKNIDYVDSKVLKILKEMDLHCCQSYYSRSWLLDRKINNIAMLTDIFDEKIINSTFEINKKKKIVVYNPSKGIEFTLSLIEKSPEIVFIPAINMNRSEVISLLKSAMVYIDFGNHPGQDRLPREAAIYGCCVLTGIKGSAAYYEDVPIESKFKFTETSASIQNIKTTILEIFLNYENYLEEFENFRLFSLATNIRFENSLNNIFEF